jgi:hypothetical protein
MRLALAILFAFTLQTRGQPMFFDELIAASQVAPIVSTWNPSSYAGLVLSFDSASLSSSNNGDLLRIWPETVNGWHGYLTNTANAYVTNNWFGSYPAVRCSGASSYLNLSNASAGVCQNQAAVTVCSVIAADSLSTAGYHYAFHACYHAANDGTVRAGMGWLATALYMARGRDADVDAGVNITTNAITGQKIVLCAVFNFSAGNETLYTNGVAAGTASLLHSGNSPNTTSANVSLLGDAAQETFIGWCGGVWVWQHAFSSTEVTSFTSAARTRYGF